MLRRKKTRPLLLILHQLPLEYYPPVTNLIQYFAKEDQFRIQALSSPTPPGMPPFTCENAKIFRCGTFPVPRLKAFFTMLSFGLRGLFQILVHRPDAIFYFESHSSLPVILAKRIFRNRTPLFIHYHELYCPEDFQPRGHRMIRSLGEQESRFLYPLADWISQTNPKRLEIFSNLHPTAAEEKLHILPNFPPDSWRGMENNCWRKSSQGFPLRIIYVGALSLEDTYIAQFTSWVASHPELLSLEIYAFRVPDSVEKHLENLNAPNIRVSPQFLPYSRLPETLVDFHVGVVLYKGNTKNFIYNQPNKVFEYLAGGVDVWFPTEMKGMNSLVRRESRPRILPLDFKELESWEIGDYLHRLPEQQKEDHFFTSVSLLPLAEEFRKNLSFD